MNTYLCSTLECTNLYNYICYCNGIEKGFCKDHLSLHMSTEGEHDIKKKNFCLTIDENEILIAQCEVSLKKLDSIREKMNKKSKEIIEKIVEKTKQNLDCIREKQSFIFKVLEFLRQNERVKLKNNQSEHEKFIFNYAKNPKAYYDKLLVEESEIIETLDLDKKEENLKIKAYRLNRKYEKIKDYVINLYGQYESIKSEIFSNIMIVKKKIKTIIFFNFFLNNMNKENHINISDIRYREIVIDLKYLVKATIRESLKMEIIFSELQKYINDD